MPEGPEAITQVIAGAHQQLLDEMTAEEPFPKKSIGELGNPQLQHLLMNTPENIVFSLHGVAFIVPGVNVGYRV